MWLWALGFAVAWTAGVALFASSLLLTPPYYAHRKPHQGLSLKGLTPSLRLGLNIAPSSPAQASRSTRSGSRTSTTRRRTLALTTMKFPSRLPRLPPEFLLPSSAAGTFLQAGRRVPGTLAGLLFSPLAHQRSLDRSRALSAFTGEAAIDENFIASFRSCTRRATNCFSLTAASTA